MTTNNVKISGIDRSEIDVLLAIIRNKIPLMDVRAPVEYEKGAFNHSVNFPLMNNNERAEVGICYKKSGQEAAIVLGNALVSGHNKENRLGQWKEFTKTNPNGYLYCFRGGLRSKTVQRWLKESGVNYPLINGGYKALRQFLINEIEQLAYTL